TIFFEAFDGQRDRLYPDTPYNFTNNGQPILDMINLYLRCKDASTAPPNTTCGKIYTLVSQLFNLNYEKYKLLACAVMRDVNDPTGKTIIPFKNTVTWQLRLLYGWVPYNMNPVGRACDGNALFDTVKTKEIYQELANSYRLDTVGAEGLQYNYKTEKEKTQWFNPYVQLLHDKNYLNMKSYAFSI